ncbi:MAG: chemotaxis protein CheW [Phototrophicaceae bacterium]|jgi:purine-binding chemotaxis protein CheW
MTAPNPLPEALRPLFDQRATQYAALPKPKSNPADQREMLVFTLGTETYALDAAHIQAIRPLPTITRVPNAPSYYPGVVNLRGVVLTVFDLRGYLNLPQTSPAHELIIVHYSGRPLGFLAEHVSEVVRIPKSQIEPLEDRRAALGVYAHAGALITLLDLERLFTETL